MSIVDNITSVNFPFECQCKKFGNYAYWQKSKRQNIEIIGCRSGILYNFCNIPLTGVNIFL